MEKVEAGTLEWQLQACEDQPCCPGEEDRQGGSALPAIWHWEQSGQRPQGGTVPDIYEALRRRQVWLEDSDER